MANCGGIWYLCPYFINNILSKQPAYLFVFQLDNTGNARKTWLFPVDRS